MADRRTDRTRHAVRQAFVALITEGRYDSISVNDIIAAAGIGKSTFYEHYRSKEDLLGNLMDGMLRELAATVGGEAAVPKLRGLLDHFWGNRRLGRVVFGPSMAPAIARRLAVMIEEQTISADRESNTRMRLFAVQRAHGQIALLNAWTTGEIAATVDQVTAALFLGGEKPA